MRLSDFTDYMHACWDKLHPQEVKKPQVIEFEEHKIHPLDNFTTMEDFVSKIHESPIAVYRTLLREVSKHGIDFPFPPYANIVQNLTEYLEKRNDEKAEHLRSEIAKLDKSAPPFYLTAQLFRKFLNLYPLDKERDDGKIPNTYYIHSNNICPISRGEDGLIEFQFLCNCDLDLMFFVNARVIPVFAIGVGSDEAFNPKPFDGLDLSYKSAVTRSGFFNHDLEHRDAMRENDISDFPILRALSLNQKINSEYAKIEDPSLKKAVEGVLFTYFHEGGSSYHIDQEDIENVESRDYSPIFSIFPEEYQESHVMARINDAQKWLCNIFTQELRSAESLGSLQAVIDDEVKTASYKI